MGTDSGQLATDNRQLCFYPQSLPAFGAPAEAAEGGKRPEDAVGVLARLLADRCPFAAARCLLTAARCLLAAAR